MLRQNDIDRLQGVRGLTRSTAGAATGLREAEVVTIHPHGTLDARMTAGRAVTVGARYPIWYEPQIGDRVLLGELQGDERMRVVLQAMNTKTGGAPKVVS